jgi:predicted metalloendopeptidase
MAFLRACCVVLLAVSLPAVGESRLGFDPADLSRTVRAQDDFFDYVNGPWSDVTPIPPEWPAYGAMQIVQERGEAQLRKLIERATDPSRKRSADEVQLGALYTSFMDESRVERLGATPLAPELARIDALASHEDVMRYFGRAIAIGVEVPVNFFIETDARDPTRNMPYFWQDGLGVPDRDYYLKETDAYARVRDAYRAHIEKLLDLVGIPNGAEAAKTITAIELDLAKHQWSSTANRDRERIYNNRFTLRQAAELAKELDWRAMLTAGEFPTDGTFVIAQDDYFASLGKIVRARPVADWQTYLRFKYVKAMAPYLDSAVVAENFDFEGRTLRGQEQLRPRWKRGVQLANSALGELVGKLYVAEHFPPDSKARIQSMVDSLSRAFGVSIDSLAWMSAPTKAAAHEKLARFKSKIGYPDKWRDFSGLVIEADDLVGNVQRSRLFEHRYYVGKLGKPVDRTEWDITPQTVNAYYRPTFNEVVFPAAILQPPLFDPNADDATNYGAIGAVIGHEFSHGFDDQGRKFDGDGRLRDWWSPGDAEEYVARSRKLVQQYSQFKPLPDEALNGELTLGENIGDLAGLMVAYRAYHLSLGGRPAPVIDGFTADQRFFIGYAQAWRGKMRDELLREIVSSDPHAPNRFRVIGVLRNVDAFYRAFDVKPGDGMYLSPEERVTIW